jgi:hypothetical protein
VERLTAVDGANAFADTLAAHPKFGDPSAPRQVLPVLGELGDRVPGLRDAAMGLFADGLRALALADRIDQDSVHALWRVVLSNDGVSDDLRTVLNHGRPFPKVDDVLLGGGRPGFPRRPRPDRPNGSRRMVRTTRHRRHHAAR